MPDPHRLPDLRQIPRHIQDIRIRPAGQNLMLLLINMLDVHQQQIRIPHQLIKLSAKRLLPCKGRAARIDRRMNALLLRLAEQLDHKIYLHERLPAAHRNPAFSSPV